MDIILEYLGEQYQDNSDKMFTGKELEQALGIESKRLNPAIDMLENHGLIDSFNYLGTAPYDFGEAKISSRGLYELERKRSYKKALDEIQPVDFDTQLRGNFKTLMQNFIQSKEIRPPTPIGSPYGFTDYDWEIVSTRKNDLGTLYVTLGSKFKSEYYDIDMLRKNVCDLFKKSVQKYNEEYDKDISLDFIILQAGYGEHLFNQIARDIISSDIAVFDTSDLAPNVFLELGVALTWGSRVFLVKHKDAPKPSSDISGHTYIDYSDSALDLLNLDQINKVYRMVERALWKKG
jgi:hypothetical protein